MKNTTIAVAVLIAAAVLVWFWFSQKGTTPTEPGGETAQMEEEETGTPAAPTTQTPKPSASGSAPAPASAGSSNTGTTGYYQKVSIQGVTLTPIEVAEDSRCPSDAQCIQAGTIKVRTRIESATSTTDKYLELGKAVTVGTDDITLTQVTPAPKIGQAIGSNLYRFTYEVKKR